MILPTRWSTLWTFKIDRRVDFHSTIELAPKSSKFTRWRFGLVFGFGCPLRHDVVQDVAGDVGQTEIAAGVTIG